MLGLNAEARHHRKRHIDIRFGHQVAFNLNGAPHRAHRKTEQQGGKVLVNDETNLKIKLKNQYRIRVGFELVIDLKWEF